MRTKKQEYHEMNADFTKALAAMSKASFYLKEADSIMTSAYKDPAYTSRSLTDIGTRIAVSTGLQMIIDSLNSVAENINPILEICVANCPELKG